MAPVAAGEPLASDLQLDAVEPAVAFVDSTRWPERSRVPLLASGGRSASCTTIFLEVAGADGGPTAAGGRPRVQPQ
jgi:hypothetical protein